MATIRPSWSRWKLTLPNTVPPLETVMPVEA